MGEVEKTAANREDSFGSGAQTPLEAKEVTEAPRGPECTGGGEVTGRLRAALDARYRGPNQSFPESTPMSQESRLGPRPASGVLTRRLAVQGLWAAKGPGQQQARLGTEATAPAGCTPPALHSLGQVVTSGHQHLEPVKSAFSSPSARVSLHPLGLPDEL